MKTSEHCVKSLKNLSIKTQQGRRQRRRSSIFIVFSGQISRCSGVSIVEFQKIKLFIIYLGRVTDTAKLFIIILRLSTDYEKIPMRSQCFA